MAFFISSVSYSPNFSTFALIFSHHLCNLSLISRYDGGLVLILPFSLYLSLFVIFSASLVFLSYPCHSSLPCYPPLSFVPFFFRVFHNDAEESLLILTVMFTLSISFISFTIILSLSYVILNLLGNGRPLSLLSVFPCIPVLSVFYPRCIPFPSPFHLSVIYLPSASVSCYCCFSLPCLF